MSWVKFHDELRSGAKRGLPRAVRFVFLELCLLARPGRGTLELPVGMPDLDAVHDVLGGDRREVKEALRVLTGGDDPMLVLDGEPGARRIVIPSWARWNAGATEAPGASTERSRKHRNGRATARNDEATVMQRPLHDDATVGQRSGNDRSPVEEIREDPPYPPAGGTLELVPVGPPKVDPVDRVWSAYVAAYGHAFGHLSASRLQLSDSRRRLIRRRIAESSEDQVASAGRGVFRDSWCVEKRKVEPEYVWQNLGNVERFAALAASDTPRRADAPAAPPSTPEGRARGQAALDAVIAEKRARLAAVAAQNGPQESFSVVGTSEDPSGPRSAPPEAAQAPALPRTA